MGWIALGERIYHFAERNQPTKICNMSINNKLQKPMYQYKVCPIISISMILELTVSIYV